MLGRIVMATLTAAAVAGPAAPRASAQVDPTVGSTLSLDRAEGRALDLNPQLVEARLGTKAADFTLAQRQAAFGATFTTYLIQRGQTTPATSQLTGGGGADPPVPPASRDPSRRQPVPDFGRDDAFRVSEKCKQKSDNR